MGMWVLSLASLSGLRIWRCYELYRSQIKLGSGVALVETVAGSYSSDLNPSLGTSICSGFSPTKQKKKIWTGNHILNYLALNAIRCLPVRTVEGVLKCIHRRKVDEQIEQREKLYAKKC